MCIRMFVSVFELKFNGMTKCVCLHHTGRRNSDCAEGVSKPTILSLHTSLERKGTNPNDFL